VLAKGTGGHVVRRLFDGGRVVFVDECANMVSAATTDPGALTCTTPDETFYTYQATGEITAIYDATKSYADPNHRLAYTYDTIGRITAIDDPDGGTTLQTYDRVGNLATLTNGRGQLVVYDYDDLDRVTLIDPTTMGGSGNVHTFSYDPVTRRRQQSTTGPGVKTTHSYDSYGRESRQILDIWGYEYVTDFETDLLGRTTRIVYPSPNADVTYQYDGSHLVSVCGRGDADCANNPDDWFIDDIEYDGLGRPIDISLEPGDHTYQYDPITRRLLQSKLTNGSGDDLVKLDYTYDDAGNIATVTDGHTGVTTDDLDATASYLYDHRNRLIQRTIDGNVAHFKYDELGNLTGRDLPTAGSAANQLYADATRPHAITQRHDGATYLYDDDGNVTKRGLQYITYDWRNLPTCVGTSPGACNIASYYYDADGVRISEQTSGVPLRILVGGGLFEHVTNTSTAEAHVYAFGQRIATQLSDNAEIRAAAAPFAWPFPVDPEIVLWMLGILGTAGLLAWLTKIGAARMVYARPATSGLALVLSVAIATPVYGGGGGGDSDWIRRWYHTDHLGSAVLVTNEMGDVVHRRVFEPFGKVIAQSTTEFTDELFTGKERGIGTGIHDFGARQYDSEAGRFLSIDPIVQFVGDPQTLNPYSYTRNNPVMLFDPNGMWFNLHLGNIAFVAAAAIEPPPPPPNPPYELDFNTRYAETIRQIAELGYLADQFSRYLKQFRDLIDALRKVSRNVGGIFGAHGESPTRFAESSESQPEETPAETAAIAIFRNREVPDDVIDRISIAELAKLAELRVRIAELNREHGAPDARGELQLSKNLIRLGTAQIAMALSSSAAGVLNPARTPAQLGRDLPGVLGGPDGEAARGGASTFLEGVEGLKGLVREPIGKAPFW